MAGARPPSLLPPGVTVEVADWTARLRFDRQAAAAAYQELTRPAERVPVSLYLIDHWVPVLGPQLFTILAKLQCAARYRRDPAPTLADLAAAAGLSLPSLRRFVQWWGRPREETLAWAAMRAYVQDIRPAVHYHGTGSAPYQFVVLLEDVLHPKHRGAFEQRVLHLARAGALREGAAILATPSHQGALLLETGGHAAPQPGYPPDSPLQGSQTETQSETLAPPRAPDSSLDDPTVTHQGSQTETQSETLAPPLPPHPPPRLPACMPKAGKATVRDSLILSAGSDQAPTPRLACRLAETLGELGVHRDLADYLVAAPERAYWAEQWATWFPAIAHRIRNPRGFLASRIEGAAAGNPAYQIPPGEYLDRQEAGAKRQRQAERTQSLLAAIPKPEAREEPPAAPVAPELAPFWETLRGAATGAARGLLDHAAPLRVDTGRLVVAAPEGVRLQLRKREGPLAAALTDRHPEITGIEWVAPAAAGETGECSS